MDSEEIITISVIPVSELLSHIVLDMVETAQKAKEITFQRDNFNTFSTYLDRTSKILSELSDPSLEASALRPILEILGREAKASSDLVSECRERSKFHLLINSRKIVKRVENSTREIGRALSLIPLASLAISASVNGRIVEICENMSRAEYCANVAEEEILEKIELGIKERNRARFYANVLVVRIAEALGISVEQFRDEIEEAKKWKEESESSQVEQIMALLEKADATTISEEEKEKKYFSRRNSLGSQRLAPLQGFVCSLTEEVMVDPVETSSGQTFERSAIEKWIAGGNNVCPVTNAPLDAASLRPNRTLRESIEEWRERNGIIAVAALRPKLESESDEEVSEGLGKLRGLCAESEFYRDLVTMEDYSPILIGLLNRKNREIRNAALMILSVLANHNEGNKEKIANLDNALESIVRSLARQPEESASALRLLLELSRSDAVRDLIGNVQGCILLLVTMLSSDDEEVARDTGELIKTLSLLDQNVKQMAKANYFKPLLHRISTGSEEVRMSMAETLSEIELTDHSKLSIVEDGALDPLIQMLSHGDLENKKVSMKCLVQLSSLPQNGLSMLEKGAVKPLFEILYQHSLQLPKLREQVAETIMNLSLATAKQELDGGDFPILESEDDVFKFFSLVSLTEPETQRSILGAFVALCERSSGLDIRTKLRQISAVRVLVQLCHGENLEVRSNAVKLFFSLTKDGDDRAFLEYVNYRRLSILLKIIETSNDAEEVSASLGIITNLPRNSETTRWLVDYDALRIIRAALLDRPRDSLQKRRIEENAAAALCRFTVSTNLNWQTRVAETGLIPVLVQMLSSESVSTKRNAAISLKNLSETSKTLTKPVKTPGWFFPCCTAAPEGVCAAHSGVCGVESSFCLVEAEAVEPLARLLGNERDSEACEAYLDALLTLVDPEKPVNGCRVLDQANAVAPIVKLLGSDCVALQEKCLKTLEMVFKVDELRGKYGRLAQMALVDITQMKASELKEIRSLAAKLLSQLGVLGAQSSFF